MAAATSSRTVCPASGQPCTCILESIRWRECQGVALEAARNLLAQPSPNSDALQRARGFERRSEVTV